MLSNAFVQGTTTILRNILPADQTLSKIVFEDTIVKFNEFKDSETVDLMVRFEKASKTGEEISNKLGLTEEQIIQLCLKDDKT